MLAPSQETLWEFARCFAPDDPGALGYNVFEAVQRAGPFEEKAFRLAVGEVMARHDALRLVFDEVADSPILSVRGDELSPKVSITDLTREPEKRRGILAGSLLGRESTRAFDVRTGPLWSVAVVLTAADTWTVAVSMFHLIADGWSTGVFLRDLDMAYRARVHGGPPLAPLALDYAAATARPAVSHQEFWRDELLPLPDKLPFTASFDKPDLGAAASAGLALPADLARQLQALSRRLRVTPFVLSMAAYRITLGAVTGWDRIVLGTTTAGRDEPGMTDLIGQFTRNIYVSTTFGPRATLGEAVETQRAATMAAMRHAAPFQEIARAVNPAFDASRPWPFLLLYHSWFQSAAPQLGAGTSGVDVVERRTRTRVPPVADTSRLDLWAKRGEPGLTMAEDRRHVTMNYNPTFYDRDAVVAALLGYRNVLRELVRDPSQRIGDIAS